MNPWIIGTLILSLISPIFYTRSMLVGKAKPHRVTRLIIWLASIAGVLGVLHSSNVAGKLFALIFLSRATYLLAMSVKFGIGGLSRIDKYCLVSGIVALIAYAATKNGALTIGLGIVADLIGYIPTFIKTYNKPESEDPFFFGIEGLAAVFGIIAVGELRADMLFPVYFAISSAAMIVLIYRKKVFIE